MKIKLTQAQEKLINALVKDPQSDAYDHLKHIRNRQISDKLVNTMLHLGLLYKDIKTGKIILPPQEMTTEKETGSEYNIPTTNTATGENNDETIMSQKQVITPKNDSDADEAIAETIIYNDIKRLQNKKEIIMEMLIHKTTLDEMVAATGWLVKSVRGVISQLKKEKNLVIIREKDNLNINHYSIKPLNSIE